nr:MAG TPA: hypothetical protein [Caudoviricetes sp.]
MKASLKQVKYRKFPLVSDCRIARKMLFFLHVKFPKRKQSQQTEEVRKLKIVEVKKSLSRYEKVLYYPIFNGEEKECASKITEQLKGMTIYEAQQLLSKVSKAIVSPIRFLNFF